MAIEGVVADPGTGGSEFAVDNVTGGSGTVSVPYVKLMSGADTATGLIAGDATNGLDVDVTRVSGTVTVDGSGVTQPVSHAALTELAAAINASAQMDVNIAASAVTVAVSNAGLTELAAAINASSQVDVNLAASAGALAVTQSGTWDEVGINDSGNSITVDNAQLSVVGTGTEATAMRVTIASDSTGVLSVDDNGGALTVDNGGTFAVQAACTNAGTFATQVDGSALTALQLIDDPVLADDAAFTPATSKVMMAGFQADEGSTDSVDEGDAGAARMTLDRKVIVNPQPHTAGGLSIARDIDLDNSTLTVVKNAAGQLYGMSIANLGTVTVFVKFYDAASGTLGTGTPVLTIPIPGNATDDTLLSTSFGGHGLAFATGICVGAGTGVADADNTDPGTNIVIANIFYK